MEDAVTPPGPHEGRVSLAAGQGTTGTAPLPRLRLAMVGTRGVPAAYGGFETAVEEIGRRLVASGHDITVYCRSGSAKQAREPVYAGMRLVHLPAARRRSLETLSHTALSLAHLLSRGSRFDAVLVFNAANSVFLPLLRLRRIPVATHVDGLEWRRGKWGPAGQRYYRAAETLAVRWSDALIADARGISEYYSEEFGASTDEIAYGAPILADPHHERLADLGCTPQGYHLVVARFEPENHVDMAIEGYLLSGSELPLVVVGSTPYPGDHDRALRALAARSDSVRMVGGIWDQDLLDALYAGSCTYIHGHSVGGTNPSLLRAMGAGAPVVAYDVNFNRDVLGEEALVFKDSAALADLLRRAELDRDSRAARGRRLRERAAQDYTWDAVAKQYEDLCVRLAAGLSQRALFSGRRRVASTFRRR